MSADLNRTVVCDCPRCENFGVEIYLENDIGADVVCNGRLTTSGELCGCVLADQADWYEPPASNAPEHAADLIAAMTPEERAALIAILAAPSEDETP